MSNITIYNIIPNHYTGQHGQLRLSLLSLYTAVTLHQVNNNTHVNKHNTRQETVNLALALKKPVFCLTITDYNNVVCQD